jgi:hypothetical protein
VGILDSPRWYGYRWTDHLASPSGPLLGAGRFALEPSGASLRYEPISTSSARTPSSWRMWNSAFTSTRRFVRFFLNPVYGSGERSVEL